MICWTPFKKYDIHYWTHITMSKRLHKRVFRPNSDVNAVLWTVIGGHWIPILDKR